MLLCLLHICLKYLVLRKTITIPKGIVQRLSAKLVCTAFHESYLMQSKDALVENKEALCRAKNQGNLGLLHSSYQFWIHLCALKQFNRKCYWIFVLQWRMLWPLHLKKLVNVIFKVCCKQIIMSRSNCKYSSHQGKMMGEKYLALSMFSMPEGLKFIYL